MRGARAAAENVELLKNAQIWFELPQQAMLSARQEADMRSSWRTEHYGDRV
jgi:hypothetical protein